MFSSSPRTRNVSFPMKFVCLITIEVLDTSAGYWETTKYCATDTAGATVMYNSLRRLKRRASATHSPNRDGAAYPLRLVWCPQQWVRWCSWHGCSVAMSLTNGSLRAIRCWRWHTVPNHQSCGCQREHTHTVNHDPSCCYSTIIPVDFTVPHAPGTACGTTSQMSLCTGSLEARVAPDNGYHTFHNCASPPVVSMFLGPPASA